MKKLALAVAALTWAGLAGAGDYHKGEELRCSQCHTMHATRQHQLGSAAAERAGRLSGTASDKLLVYATVSETCLACHDGGGIPDVFGTADVNQLGVRSAGALNGTVTGHTLGLGKDGVTAYADWMGHTLESTTPPPGLSADKAASWGTKTFSCDDCHAVHGNAGFRNLGPKFGGRAGVVPFADSAIPTYAIAPATDLTVDVTVEDLVTQYNTASVSFSTAGGANRMNAFCANCHGNFHGDANVTGAQPGTFKRHPTSGVTKASGELLIPANDMMLRPNWTDANKTTFEASCLSCHKGHGNARGFGLLYPANALTKDVNLEDGDAAIVGTYYPIRNLCTNCHPMGRF